MESSQDILSEIHSINNEKTDILNIIYLLKQRINKLDIQSKELEKNLYEKCNHEWQVDRTNIGEHTEFICKKCNLYKDNYYYLR